MTTPTSGLTDRKSSVNRRRTARAFGLGRTIIVTFLVAAPTRTTSDGNQLELRIGMARAGGGHSITTVPLEAYVARVLTAEALPDSRPAALEALAITVRTYALANRGRHGADAFDLCDETHCQVMRTATPATERAAEATAGRILLNGGVPASVYYSASCGGRTEVPSAVWPGESDPPFLPTQRDDACGGGPVWAAELAGSDLLRSLRAGGFRGDRLRDVRIVALSPSGRVARLRVEGLQPDEISGQDLRVVVGRTLGWQHIRSTAFDLTRTPDGYRFRGRGSGHGVGLCVIGSARRAQAGENAEAILRRYYPGLTIATTSDTAVSLHPGVLVTLSDGDAGERDRVAELAARAREGLARTLGVAPPRVALRFHATVDSYERATARPWFTSGTLVDGDIHLLPQTVLRERGVLERTIRHEIVHVMTNDALDGRPLWVREGAAVYFASEPSAPGGGDPPTPRPSASCPEDADLLRPISPGALTDAYARARACFERQIAQGRPWREVR